MELPDSGLVPLTPAQMAAMLNPISPGIEHGVFLLLIDSAGRIWLGERGPGSSHGVGELAAPGGKVDPAELVPDTFDREMREETGLSGLDVHFVVTTLDAFPEATPPRVFLTYHGIARVPDGLVPTLPEGERLSGKNLGWAPYAIGDLVARYCDPLQRTTLFRPLVHLFAVFETRLGIPPDRLFDVLVDRYLAAGPAARVGSPRASADRDGIG